MEREEKKNDMSRLHRSGFDVGVKKSYGSFFSSLRERTEIELKQITDEKMNAKSGKGSVKAND